MQLENVRCFSKNCTIFANIKRFRRFLRNSSKYTQFSKIKKAFSFQPHVDPIFSVCRHIMFTAAELSHGHTIII
jgi:hypothetical protein